jgi:23S rRNA (guanosine2251-2'-O)-methyltransferase
MKREKIFGINPVTEALKSGRPVQRLLIAEQRKSDKDITEIMRLARSGGVEVRFTTRDALNREAHQGVHQGVKQVFPT